MAIFPEGTVNDALRLKPLKTGAARIALGAREKGARGLRIVPVGLVYEDKTRPRSRVLVRAGEPIDLDDAMRFLVPTGTADRPRATTMPSTGSRRSSPPTSARRATDYDQGAEVKGLELAASVYLRRPDADPNRVQPISEIEPTLRRLLALARRRSARRSSTRPRPTASNLEVIGLRDVDVIPGNTPARVVNRVRLELGQGAACWPRSRVARRGGQRASRSAP